MDSKKHIDIFMLTALLTPQSDSSSSDVCDSPLPTVEKRIELYLNAVFGQRVHSREEYLQAREVILNAMAEDVLDEVVGHREVNERSPAQVLEFSNHWDVWARSPAPRPQIGDVIPSRKLGETVGISRSLELDVTPLHRDFPSGEIAKLLSAHVTELDGVCIRFIATCETERIVIARARIYDIGQYSVVGDFLIDPAVGDYRLYEKLLPFCILHCLVMGMTPETIIWAPGFLRSEVESRAANFSCRPLILSELTQAPLAIRQLAASSQRAGRENLSGLLCVDRNMVKGLLQAVRLLAKEDTPDHHKEAHQQGSTTTMTPGLALVRSSIDIAANKLSA
jgi:hypothetical protein